MDLKRIKQLSGISEVNESDQILIDKVKQYLDDMGLGFGSYFDYGVTDTTYADSIDKDIEKLISLIRNPGDANA